MGKGLPDAFESEYGVTGAAADPDLDGLDNLSEYRRGTDPNRSDTDGGGESDGSEAQSAGQEPLELGDDRIETPEYFTAVAQVGSVALSYDFKPSYERLLLYRAPAPGGPWSLQGLDLPSNGRAVVSADNDQTFHYQLQAEDSSGSRSGFRRSEPVTPRLDPVPPVARIFINQGEAETPSRDVYLTFTPSEDYLVGFEDITEVYLGNDPSYAGAQWQPFAQNLAWRMAGVDPGATALVYALFRDAAGNVSKGAAVGAIIYRPPVSTWLRCDADGDKKIDIADAVWNLEYQFTGGPAGLCRGSLDCDGNGALDVTDPLRLLGILFLGAPQFDNFRKCEPIEGCTPNCP